MSISMFFLLCAYTSSCQKKNGGERERELSFRGIMWRLGEGEGGGIVILLAKKGGGVARELSFRGVMWVDWGRGGG